MYLPVSKELFVEYMIRPFPNAFTREGLSILFEYIKSKEERSGIEDKFDPDCVQLAYAESNYCRFLSKENRQEDPIGEGSKLCSSISTSGRTLKELQQNVKKHIERSGATLIGFTSNKTVVYTRD